MSKISYPTNWRDAAVASGAGRVDWRDEADTPRSAAAEPAIQDEQFHLASPIRFTNRYPHKRSYAGLYYFASTKSHVGHESLLEAEALMWLDMFGEVTAVASQPMRMLFADGTNHVPDFFLLRRTNEQVVVDVKPESLVTDQVRLQFAKTQAMCDRIGWRYEVHLGIPPQEKANLEFISAFRLPRFQPPPEVIDSVLGLLDRPRPIDNVVTALSLPSPLAHSYLCHLVWRRILQLDLSARITGTAIIERSPHAHA